MDAQSTQGRVIENRENSMEKLNEKLSYYDEIKEAFPDPFVITLRNEEFTEYHNFVKALPIDYRNQARQATKGCLPLAFHVDIRPRDTNFVVTIASRGFRTQSPPMKDVTTFWVEARVHRLAKNGIWQEDFHCSHNNLRLQRFREVTIEKPSYTNSENSLKSKYSVATLSFTPYGLKEKTAREWITNPSTITVVLELTMGANGTVKADRIFEMTRYMVEKTESSSSAATSSPAKRQRR